MAIAVLDITKDDLISEIHQDGIRGTLKKYQRTTLPSKVLFELFEDPSATFAYLFLASYIHVPSSLLVKLVAVTQDQDVLKAIAGHARTPREVLQQLASNQDPVIRAAIAANRQITPQTAAILGGDSNPCVRATLSANPTLFSRIQMMLVDDPEDMVKTTLALQKNANVDVFDALMKDESLWVQSAMSVLANVSHEKLLQMADSENVVSQLGLLQRGELPDPVLESLSFSKHPQVSAQAVFIKELTEDETVGWARGDQVEVRRVIATKENLVEAIQMLLVQDIDFEVRSNLASNKTICQGAIDRFINDGECLCILAENEGLTPEQIEKLCDYQDDTVHKVLATRNDLDALHLEILVNERCDVDVVYHLAMNHWRLSDISPAMTRILVGHRLPTLRAFGAGSMQLNETEMATLLVDPSPLVRRGFVSSPVISRSHLEALSMDKDSKVSDTASRKLEAEDSQPLEAELKPQPDEDQEEKKGLGVKGFMKGLIKRVKG